MPWNRITTAPTAWRLAASCAGHRERRAAAALPAQAGPARRHGRRRGGAGALAAPAARVPAPSEFIPLAEQTGLIYPLTRWVLEAALRQCQAWRAVGLDIPVAVNLSQAHAARSAVARDGRAAARPLTSRPTALVLEITESSLMADPARAGENLTQLRALGVRMSIDDFGTGYSSLAYLKHLPVDELKIDQSFVQAMATDASARAIVRAIIDLADALDLRVVAEGVEDRATWDVLAGSAATWRRATFSADRWPRPSSKRGSPTSEPSWQNVGARSARVDAVLERVHGRKARLTTEEEVLAVLHEDAA